MVSQTREIAAALPRLPGLMVEVEAQLDNAIAAGKAAGKIEAERVAAGVEARVLAYSDIAVETIQNLIGGDGKVPTYTDPVMDVVLTDQPTIILPEDVYRIGAIIQCDRVDIAIGQGDARPDFDGGYQIMYSGGIIPSTIFMRKAIFAVARWRLGSDEAQMDPPPPINVRCAVTIERLVDGNIPQVSLGDRVTGYWPDPVHSDFRSAIRTLVNTLHDAGIYSKLGFLRITGASLANDAINLANPTGPQTIQRNIANGAGVLTHTPYHSVHGDGVAYLDTQLNAAAAKIAFDRHSISVAPGSALLIGSTAIYSPSVSGDLGLQASRSATNAGFRSGGGLDPYPVSPGTAIAMSRRSATEYTQYLDGSAPEMVQRVIEATAITGRTITLLAPNTSGGPAVASKVPERFSWFGADLTDAEMLTVRNAIESVLDVADEIRGAA